MDAQWHVAKKLRCFFYKLGLAKARLAFAKILSARLGENSSAYILAPDLMKMIVEMLQPLEIFEKFVDYYMQKYSEGIA